ncbi:MAG: phosphodiester glycosidase family protein [Bacilli bacterium]
MNKENDIEVLNFENEKKSHMVIYKLIPILLIPFLFVLTIISLHSTKLIIKPLNYIIMVLLFSLILIYVVGLFKYKKKKKKKKLLKVVIPILITIYILGCTCFTGLLYGPYKNFREWLISTSMATMNHQYLCEWFYSNKEIKKVLKNNYVIEVDETTDTDLIDVDKEIHYKNEYEKQILDHQKDEEYKIIDLTVNGCNGHLVAIYDPSMVKVAVTRGLGSYGQYVTTMASNNNALVAVNGGGFFDPGNSSTGGWPTGITIANNKIVTDNNYSSYTQNGGLIGFNNDNVLVLMKTTTAREAINNGIRDAVSWGPFLIVNGKPSFIKGNGGWGYAARTAIGQREDGIVLLVVIDSNSTRTRGADMVDLTEIMQNYGAVNAANLDGGTSSVLVLPAAESLKYIPSCAKDYCYINDPVDSTLTHKTRGIATSIIVTK